MKPEETTPRSKMALPPGRHCGSCSAFEYCSGIGVARADQTECDWFPVRYRFGRVIHNELDLMVETLVRDTGSKGAAIILVGIASGAASTDRGGPGHADPGAGGGAAAAANEREEDASVTENGNAPTWWTPETLASLWGVSKRTVERLVEDRAIGHCKVGRQIRISPEAYDEFIARHWVPARRGRLVLGELLAVENPEGRELREYLARLARQIIAESKDVCKEAAA
jgi:excisionase family DNA binding protein